MMPRKSLYIVALFIVGNANAATDWDAKLRQAFTPPSAAPQISFALAVSSAPPPRRDMTPNLRLAREHWSELSAGTQALIRPWLLRPTNINPVDPSSIVYPAGSESVHATTHFCIHYLDMATPALASNVNAATLSYVTGSVAPVLENVYTQEHVTLGLKLEPQNPNGGACGGNKALYDVFLADLATSGAYGYVATEGSSNGGTAEYSYMVLDNNFSDSIYGLDPMPPLQVTVAHEYFHTIQFGYSAYEDDAFMEQSSTWMEDVVYPSIHDNYQYLGEVYQDTNGNGRYDKGEAFTDRNHNGLRDEGSLDYPDASLNAFDTPQSVQYGRFLWLRYRSERFSNGIVKAIWEHAAQTPGDTFGSISAVLQNSYGSSLAESFQDYATWGYDKVLYQDGANYPLVYVDRTVSGSAFAFDYTSSSVLGRQPQPQMHLSTVYEQILSPKGTYTFSVSGGAPALTMLVDVGSGKLLHQAVLIANGKGTWATPIGAVKAIAVISNTSPITDGMHWSFAGQSPPVSNTKGGGGAWVASNTDIALWLMALIYVQRRRSRRANYVL